MAKRKGPPDDPQESFQERLNLVIKESDRGAIVVGACLVEDELDSMLWALFQWNKVPRKVIEGMFDATGPLGTFSAKAKMSYAFGLISKKTYDDICVIRDLRNDAAHTGTEFSISEKSLRTRVRKLYHSIKYELSEDAESAEVSTDKFLFGVCTGLLCVQLMQDFNTYSLRVLKLQQAEYEEMLAKVPPHGGGLLSH